MVTPAPARRFANAVVALAFAGPAVLLGGVAWADDPTPAPAVDAPEAPVVQPSIGSWIVGGTLLEGTAAKPAAQPAAKPAAPPRPVAAVRTSTRARHTTPSSGIGSATSTSGPTALPFTGGHVEALFPAGIMLLVGGAVLTLVARPRRVLA